MSDPEKPKFQATATIQIDLDQVQLVDPDAAAGGDGGTPQRSAPPPLPATAMPEVMASAATPARPRASAGPSAGQRQAAQKDPKFALHVSVVIGVVVLAVVAGLVVAWRVQTGGSTPAASASSSAGPATGAAPSSSAVLTIPPIEVR